MHNSAYLERPDRRVKGHARLGMCTERKRLELQGSGGGGVIEREGVVEGEGEGVVEGVWKGVVEGEVKWEGGEVK